MDENNNFKLESVLKYDALGRIEKGLFIATDGTSREAIRRVYARNLFIRPLAKFFAYNEKKALKALQALAVKGQAPLLLHAEKNSHIRSFIKGDSIHRRSEQLNHDYFFACKSFLRTMRKNGVSNNDLAKEANWLITPEGLPAVTDFQLAISFKNTKNKLLLILAKEDLRHLLKHKRKYDKVTVQEKLLLNSKSIITKAWMQTGKKIHRFITRKILGWQDRVGPEERNI